jgi:hypothetical protein
MNCFGWILLVVAVWIILLTAIIAFMMGAHIDDPNDNIDPDDKNHE